MPTSNSNLATPTALPAAFESFESAVAELDTIVQAMESGSLPLEEALDKYQRGVELVKQCQAQLSAAEQRIKILGGDDLRTYDNKTEGV